MCRGENVQCKECFRLTPRVVQLCIRGELMVTCPETIIEGVSLEKEECRLCRYGNSKGKLGGLTKSNPCHSQSRKDGKDEESSIFTPFEKSQVDVQVHSRMTDSHKSKEWPSLGNEVHVDNHQTRLDFPEEQIMEESVLVKLSEHGIPFFSKGDETIKLPYHQTACEV
ncbi:hypothetical protein BKA59DRAFT_505208 [Fusarium tricinctum]|uniref:Uncharacterized protein n=1 Tax=Fusarium tricinctum TaxID=61284 RepID=A0A8K0S998_9HYPO|nr:hypothetical protein BKA59DRAFT_505208 [Fusarium tricinctum]